MTLPVKLSANTTPEQAAAATHAARQAAPGLPWVLVSACAALVTRTHTLQKAVARARAAAALIPADASADWLEAYAARMGRIQGQAPAGAALWATQYVQALDALRAPPVVVEPPAPTPAGKHRYQQAQLFQGAPSPFLTDEISGAQYVQDKSGPNYLLVSTATGWQWDRPGGDYIDRNGTRYGPTAWASAPSIGASKQVHGKAVHDIKRVTFDCTAMVNRAHADKRWLAVLLTATGAFRKIAGRTHPQHEAPSISVVYDDGAPATLDCTCAANGQESTGESHGVSSLPEVSAPAFLEFTRPAGPVQSAELSLTVIEHWSGANPMLHLWLLDPPTAEHEPALWGLAQQYPLDAGIETHPSIIGAHNYRDGSPDPIEPGGLNIHADAVYSPHFWGDGPRDSAKLPDRGLGKWINLPEHARIVPSTHAEPGYAPLAPGMGALRLHMPARDLKRGDIVHSHGDTAATAAIYLPEDQIGRLRRLFVRHYFRVAPFNVGPEHRVFVRNSAAVPAANGRPAVPESWAWTNLSGKNGIGHSHDTSEGGVSMTSGGPYGWQMRGGYTLTHSPGPDNGGLVMGHHLGDFYSPDRCPPGHLYGREHAWLERWGRNGLGVIYPGHWYCVETELDLNTILHAGQGWKPDGALRTWIDGKLAYERTGMVFRSGPVNTRNATQRPMREIGIRNLWLCWFHGGKTLNTVGMTQWYAALAWGTEYIGPMKLER